MKISIISVILLTGSFALAQLVDRPFDAQDIKSLSEGLNVLVNQMQNIGQIKCEKFGSLVKEDIGEFLKSDVFLNSKFLSNKSLYLLEKQPAEQELNKMSDDSLAALADKLSFKLRIISAMASTRIVTDIKLDSQKRSILELSMTEYGNGKSLTGDVFLTKDFFQPNVPPIQDDANAKIGAVQCRIERQQYSTSPDSEFSPIIIKEYKN